MNSTTGQQASALTALDLKALKQADSVSFHFVNERSTIVAHKDRDRDQPFSQDQRHEIEVGVGFTAYKGFHTSRRDGITSCFAMINASRFNETWTTVRDLLRVGDELVLEWIADNNSEVINKAQLHSDELCLIVKRRVGEKTKRMVFHVDHSIGPNNTARMIRGL
jgi:hypothetical protein